MSDRKFHYLASNCGVLSFCFIYRSKRFFTSLSHINLWTYDNTSNYIVQQIKKKTESHVMSHISMKFTCMIDWYMCFNFQTGISMHKGYAFVQFTNPFDARNACHGEDGRTILSQVLGKCLVLLWAVTHVTVSYITCYYTLRISICYHFIHCHCHLLQLQWRTRTKEKK